MTRWQSHLQTTPTPPLLVFHSWERYDSQTKYRGDHFAKTPERMALPGTTSEPWEGRLQTKAGPWRSAVC